MCSVHRIEETYLLLSCFKEIPVTQEEGLHLVNTAGCDKDEVENGEQAQLQVERAIANHPECETTEKRCEDVQVYLVPHVVLCEFGVSVQRNLP